jgi:hypothetical protein
MPPETFSTTLPVQIPAHKGLETVALLKIGGGASTSTWACVEHPVASVINT